MAEGGRAQASRARQQSLIELLRKRSVDHNDENEENENENENDMGVQDPMTASFGCPDDDIRGRDGPTNTANTVNTGNKRSLVTSILDRAVHARFCPWSTRVLRNKQIAMYEVASSVSPLRLCGSLGIRERVTAAEVDSIGELLVVGCRGGHVLVNDVQSILESVSPPGRGCGRGGKVEPGLHLRVGDAQEHAAHVPAVRWNPSDQNEIGVLSKCAAGEFLSMYDINRTRGEASRRIGLPGQAKAADFAYFPGASSSTGSGRYCVAVADERHGVLLFDSRTNATTSQHDCKPVCVLKSDSQRHTGARCVSIVDGGRVVLAGGGRDLDGYMNMWDLRNVSGNVALTFSAAPNKHQHLRRLCFKAQLGRVHGLIDESRFIPCTYPEFFLPDPASYHRVGVTMRCGWSAVLDLGRLGLSHVHAPPARHAPSEHWMDAMQAMDEAILARLAGDAGRVALPHEVVAAAHGGGVGVTAPASSDKFVRGGCWLGESFVVPSATMDKTVHVVDFSGPFRGGSGDDDEAGGFDVPSSVQLGVSHDAAGVVRVPCDGGDALLSWGTDGTWNVLRC